MNTQEFKKVAMILKEAYKELETNAIDNGVDIFGDTYIQNSSEIKLHKDKTEKIVKIDDEIKEILEDVSSIKSNQSADHQWIVNINAAIGDLRKNK